MDELSVKDAAKALGMHADTVRRWISDGKIAAEKRGKGRG
jgi:excisionase family DNA binding protein